MAGQGYTIDEALVAIGLGNFQFRVFGYAILGSLAEAMELMLLTYVGLAAEADFQLSSSEQNVISIVTYVGIIIGAWIWSAVSDSFGRKPGFLGSIIVTSLAGLISCAAPNYFILLILRFVVGLGVGGAHVFTTWFMEFVPTLERGHCMIAFFVFGSVGTSAEAILAWGIVERFGWRLLLGVSSLPSLFALCFYKKVPESPRFLYAKGELSDASKILDWGAELNKRPLPEGGLISAHREKATGKVTSEEGAQKKPEVADEIQREQIFQEDQAFNDKISNNQSSPGTSGVKKNEAHHSLKEDSSVDRAGPSSEYEKEDEINEETKLIVKQNNTRESQLSVLERLRALKENFITSMVESRHVFLQLFSPAWWKTTTLLLILFFANTYSYYGIIHLTSQLKLGNITHAEFFKDVFYISLAELPGLGLAFFIMEYFERKMSMAMMLSLGFFAFFIQTIDEEAITMATVFVTRMLMSGSFVVMQVYSEEVYPTQLRTLGVGIAIVVGRIGSIVWPLVGEWLSDDGHKTPAMIMFAVKIFVSVLSALFLPIETKGRVLEDDDDN